MLFYFDLALLSGDIFDMSLYADQICAIVHHVTHEDDVAFDKFGFGMYRMPTINEILEIELRLATELGLIIKVPILSEV